MYFYYFIFMYYYIFLNIISQFFFLNIIFVILSSVCILYNFFSFFFRKYVFCALINLYFNIIECISFFLKIIVYSHIYIYIYMIDRIDVSIYHYTRNVNDYRKKEILIYDCKVFRELISKKY